jgi:GTP-binding protein
MKITSAKFVGGVTGTSELLESPIPQVAFIGRSNVGKSSVINALTGVKDLARTSSFPGRTQQLNIFLINHNLHLIDLPGYGYAKMSHEAREKLQKLIFWYLFESPYVQKKVVLIIDALVGPTEDDLETIKSLEEHEKDIVIVANKVDKLKKSAYDEQIKELQRLIGKHKLLPCSAEKKIGIDDLSNEILK